ncbi:NB-ARC domain-containing protein [Streptosporangium vulgare]|uniref:NB-ARC domain-containing protein n=1 Tax=Streptosporangium vulgare TaxID=46190 RepID=UPI0031D643D4
MEAPVVPEEVLIGFLRALGVRLTTDPGGLAELRTLWLTWTKGRRILICLDNAHDGDQVRDLIPAEAGCAVMVTSRQPLFLLNTYDKRLSVFSEAQGVELLARLAGDDRVAADLEAAQEIVRMCDHLPLAISICGGRLATRENWTLRRLADRLKDERRRLDQLEIGRRLDKSVRASLQLSYDDCTGLQRRLLRLLSMVSAPDVPAWVAGELLATSEPEGRRPAGGAHRRPARRVLGHRPVRGDALPAARPRQDLRPRAGALRRRREPPQGGRRAGAVRLRRPRGGRGRGPLAPGLGTQGEARRHRARPGDGAGADLGGPTGSTPSGSPWSPRSARPGAWRCGSWPGGSAGPSARSATPCGPTGPTGGRSPRSCARPRTTWATRGRWASRCWTGRRCRAGRAATAAP